MTRNYQAYVANFNRVRMIELIDHEMMKHRLLRARASLVFNPLGDRSPSTAGTQT